MIIFKLLLCTSIWNKWVFLHILQTASTNYFPPFWLHLCQVLPWHKKDKYLFFKEFCALSFWCLFLFSCIFTRNAFFIPSLTLFQNLQINPKDSGKFSFVLNKLTEFPYDASIWNIMYFIFITVLPSGSSSLLTYLPLLLNFNL